MAYLMAAVLPLKKTQASKPQPNPQQAPEKDQIINRLSLISAQRSLAWSMLKLWTDDCIMIDNLIGKQFTSHATSASDSPLLLSFRKVLETDSSPDQKAILCRAILEQAKVKADLYWRCLRVESKRLGGDPLYILLQEMKELALQGKFQEQDSLMILKLIATSNHKQTLFIFKFQVERLVEAISIAIRAEKAALQIRRLRSVALSVIELAAWTFRRLGLPALGLALLWVNLQINVLRPQKILDYLNQSSQVFSELYFKREKIQQGPQHPLAGCRDQKKVVLKEDVKGMLIQCKDLQSKQTLLDHLASFLGESASFRAQSPACVLIQRKWGSEQNSQFMKSLLRQVVTKEGWKINAQDTDQMTRNRTLIQALLNSEGSQTDSLKQFQLNYSLFKACRNKEMQLSLLERDLRVEWSMEGM